MERRWKLRLEDTDQCTTGRVQISCKDRLLRFLEADQAHIGRFGVRLSQGVCSCLRFIFTR